MQTAYHAWCRAGSADHWGRFVLARAETQRVFVAARELHNERTRNTLKHSTCSHKWWETLKCPSIPVLTVPRVVWWWLLLRKIHSCALSLTVCSVLSRSSHLCLVSLSLGEFFGLLGSCLSATSWSLHIRWWSSWCVSSISKDGCRYYCSKIKHNFLWANPSGIVSVVLAAS